MYMYMYIYLELKKIISFADWQTSALKVFIFKMCGRSSMTARTTF
jgi:hypothetical protein